jgi:hypothetical protein
MRQHVPAPVRILRHELGLALALIGLALLVRLPALLYSVTNFDESLYILIGDDLARGILPYTHICDRKPFGLFALFALFALTPFDTIVASRLGASLAVGLTAYLLHRVAGYLFDDRDRLVGPAAALAYVTFSLVDGGLASNSEVFINLASVAGLLIALQAVRGDERLRPVPMLAAGLVLGLGIQIKPTILFDMLAFLAGLLILTTPRLADLGPHLRATAPALTALVAVAALPTLAVILLYVITGHWDEWAMANIGAQRGFVDDPGQPIEWIPALSAMLEQAPLWGGGLLAGLLARHLLRGEAEARALSFLIVWVASIIALQLFLRIAADHYFLQFLPPLCLMSALLLGRLLLVRAPGRMLRAGLLATVLGLTLFAVAKDPFTNGLLVVVERHLRGQAWAADTPRLVAARLAPMLRPGDALYQVGFLPIVYHLTGAEIPTRYAFTGLPHATYAGRDGCPWVPQAVEMRRVLDTRPRFIVVEQGAFYEQLDPMARGILDDRLARDYRLLFSIPGHGIHLVYPVESFVVNAAAGAKVYELKEDVRVTTD